MKRFWKIFYIFRSQSYLLFGIGKKMIILMRQIILVHKLILNFG